MLREKIKSTEGAERANIHLCENLVFLFSIEIYGNNCTSKTMLLWDHKQGSKILHPLLQLLQSNKDW